MRFRLVCDRCGRELYVEEWVWRHECGGTLSYVLELEDVKVAWDSFAGKEWSMWRYRELLPPVPYEGVSLGEGCTPLVRAWGVGDVNVLFKLDYLCPTGSFKDRGAVVSACVLKSLHPGCTVIEDSSGNAGIASTVYSVRAGLKPVIFTPSSAPRGKRELLRLLGAELVEVQGDRQEVMRQAIEYSERRKAYYAGHCWNPFFIEGIKTLAFEVAEALGGRSPDYVVLPVGSGTLLLGVYKGFRELLELELVDKMPRIIAVQAAGYESLYELLEGRRSGLERTEVADGLRVPAPPRLEQVARAVRESDGFCVVVSEEDVRESLRKLVSSGFIVEPTTATTLAGLEHSVRRGLVRRGASVLVPLTGSGLKMIDRLLALTRG